jgi:hypothetical protein
MWEYFRKHPEVRRIPYELNSFEPPFAKRFALRQLEHMRAGMSKKDAFDVTSKELAEHKEDLLRRENTLLLVLLFDSTCFSGIFHEFFHFQHDYLMFRNMRAVMSMCSFGRGHMRRNIHINISISQGRRVDSIIYRVDDLVRCN